MAANNPKLVCVGDDLSPQSIPLGAGEPVRVQLQASSGEGCDWKIKGGLGDVVEQIGDCIKWNPKLKTGEPMCSHCVVMFNLLAKQAGGATISFEYTEPSVHSEEPKIFQLHITVHPLCPQ
jgi:hypothetical protein